MDWEKYTIFSVISGIILIICAFLPKVEAKDRFWAFVGGVALAGYGFYVAQQTSGVWEFPVIIFIIPVVAVGYLLVKAFGGRSAPDQPAPIGAPPTASAAPLTPPATAPAPAPAPAGRGGALPLVVAGGILAGIVANQTIFRGVGRSYAYFYFFSVPEGLWQWLTVAAPLLLAGLAAIAYLRPSTRIVGPPAFVFALSLLPPLVVPLLSWRYEPWIYMNYHPVAAAAIAACATSAWLRLRGWPRNGHLAAIVAGVVVYLVNRYLWTDIWRILRSMDDVGRSITDVLTVSLPVVAAVSLARRRSTGPVAGPGGAASQAVLPVVVSAGLPAAGGEDTTRAVGASETALSSPRTELAFASEQPRLSFEGFLVSTSDLPSLPEVGVITVTDQRLRFTRPAPSGEQLVTIPLNEISEFGHGGITLGFHEVANGLPAGQFRWNGQTYLVGAWVPPQPGPDGGRVFNTELADARLAHLATVLTRPSAVPAPRAPATQAPSGLDRAGTAMETVGRGFRLVARVAVSALWAVGAYVGFAAGAPLIGVIAILYLVYLWVFRGRWLIY